MSRLVQLTKFGYALLLGKVDGLRGLLCVPLWIGIFAAGKWISGQPQSMSVLAGGILGAVFFLLEREFWTTSSDDDAPTRGPDDLVRQGAEHDEDGDAERAIEHYREALDEDPTHASAHIFLGRHPDRIGFEQATSHLETGLDCLTGDDSDELRAEAYRWLAITAVKRGNYEQVLEYGPRALELDSEIKFVYEAMAKANHELGNAEAAEFHARRAEELSGDEGTGFAGH